MSRKSVQTKHVSDEEIIEACRAFRARRVRQTPDESLAHRYPAKVILAKMGQMVRRGLLACGVSLRTAWVAGDPP
jgi:hypothetical protein